MKLIKILLETSKNSFEFKELVDEIKNRGGIFLDSGDYGNVYQVGDKVIKVTTDEIELEHAQVLEKKKTKNFVYIHKVEIKNPSLGIITMDNMDKIPEGEEIPEELIKNLQTEAQKLGIDPDELDIWGPSNTVKKDNFMKDPRTGQIKMVDV
jgi:hypothetical protein